ncbi:MAG: hypothetical protein ABI333_24875 [bacterium]
MDVEQLIAEELDKSGPIVLANRPLRVRMGEDGTFFIRGYPAHRRRSRADTRPRVTTVPADR